MSNILYKNYYTDSFQKETKYILAGFDLDHTIIKPKSGNVFPKDKDDWVILYSEIKMKLQSIPNNTIIVIFSNQKGLKISENDFINKIDNIQLLLGVKFIFIAALEDDIFRKPRIGMYKYIKQHLEIKFNKKESFYVGDMAGRSNDKYDTDLKFAKNIKANFMTPEMYFLNKNKEEYKLSGYLLNNTNIYMNLNLNISNKSMVIISGYPGSGKSFLAKELIENNNKITLISKDIYKNKFDNILQEKLEKSESIIVEGLYYNNINRMKLKELASIYDYTTVYIHVTTNYDLSYHLNLYRKLYENKNYQLGSSAPPTNVPDKLLTTSQLGSSALPTNVPEIVFMKYRKMFEPINNNDWNEYYEYHPNINDKINKYFLY